jgi:phage tail sheath protein FI
MPTLLTPGLYYETFDAGANQVAGVRTDVAAFLGVAARGPLDRAAKIESWRQFQSVFGAFLEGPFLAYAIKGYFENGGRACYIVRLAAIRRTSSTDPGAIQPADRRSSIVTAIDGMVPGAVGTAIQGPLRQDLLIASVNPGARTVTWTRPLGPGFNLALNIDFETGAGEAGADLLNGFGAPALHLRATSSGSWGNRLSVRSGRTSQASTVTRSSALQPADRLSSFVTRANGFAQGTLTRVFQDPLETFVYADHVEADLNRVFWRTALNAAYDLTKPISFESLEFSLSVYEDGTLRESFGGLSLDPLADKFAPRVLEAGSVLIRGVAGGPGAADIRALPDSAAANLRRGLLRLESGRDGTAALTVEDFSGDRGAIEKRGIRAIEDVVGISSVAMPDLLMAARAAVEFAPIPEEPDPCLPRCEPVEADAPPLPVIIEAIPEFTLDEIARVQQVLIEHCQENRYRIALLDPPRFSERESDDLADIQIWRRRFDSKYAALYFPWLVVNDPRRGARAVVKAVPPSGHVLGIFARNDFDRGVHVAPANLPVRWAQDVRLAVSAEAQGILNPVGVNCIRALGGQGLVVYGTRTISSDSQWRYVSVRRLLMMIEESIEIGAQWAVFEPNDWRLQESLRLSIGVFLDSLWRKGCFRGARAEEAFFVRCDGGNNSPQMADSGRLLCEVGVAPAIPAEFVIVRVGRTADTLTVTD